MEWTDYIGWIVGIAFGAFAIYLWVSGRGDEAAKHWADIAAATTTAQEVVAAAQQLWETGQIPQSPDGQKDARFIWALDRLKTIFPNMSEAVLEMTIEAAVYWAKQGLAGLNRPIPPTPPTP